MDNSTIKHPASPTYQPSPAIEPSTKNAGLDTQETFIELGEVSPESTPHPRSLSLTQTARDKLIHLGINLKDLATEGLCKLSVQQAKLLIDAKQSSLLKKYLDLQPELKAVKSKELAEYAAAHGHTDCTIMLVDLQIDRLITTLKQSAQHAQHRCFRALLEHGLNKNILPPYLVDDQDEQSLNVHSLMRSLVDALAREPDISELEAKAIVTNFDYLLRTLLPRLKISASAKSNPFGVPEVTKSQLSEEQACQLIQETVGSALVNQTLVGPTKQSLFQLMAQYGCAQSITWCLGAGADPWQKDAGHNNALQLALLACNDDTVSELTYRRSEQHMLETDTDGNTYMHYLASRVEDQKELQLTDLPSAEDDFIEVQKQGSLLETGEVNALRLKILEQCLNVSKPETVAKLLALENDAGESCLKLAKSTKSPTAIYLLSQPLTQPQPEPSNKSDDALASQSTSASEAAPSKNNATHLSPKAESEALGDETTHQALSQKQSAPSHSKRGKKKKGSY